MSIRTGERRDELFPAPMDSTQSSDSSSGAGEGAPPLAIEEQLAAQRLAWRQEAKALTKLATAVAPLARAEFFVQLEKAELTLAKVRKKVDAIEGIGHRAQALLTRVERELIRRREELRQRFAQDLRSGCQAAGLELHVIRREEPLELRIPPFAVVIDRGKGSAEIRFARLAIAKTAAEPQSILAAHNKALGEMGRGFRAEAFFDACLAAWKCARADLGSGPLQSRAGAPAGGDRIEIRAFLPQLALHLQPRAFGIEPNAKNFRPYSRARFAYDLMQLRRAGMLVRHGWRLNLGVASGATASNMNRVLFVEDERGNGEFKLTVYFTRAES